MKSYFEIKVPIDNNALWFHELKRAMKDVPVRWQNDFYHITIAFLYDMPDVVVEKLAKTIGEIIKRKQSFNLTLDRLSAFTTQSGDIHIINITSSTDKTSAMSLIEEVREEIIKGGYDIEQDFRLHITLGRVGANAISLSELSDKISKVIIKPFDIKLSEIDYREFRGRTISQWQLLL